MSKLAVFFPGIGYTVDKPLLHYSRRLAQEQGYEIKLIPYKGFPDKVKGDQDRMKRSFQIALDQASDMLSEVDLNAYEEILFVGKSIGTTVAAKLASGFSKKETLRLVLYTPVEQTFSFDFGDAVVFSGTDDPWVGGRESRIPDLAAGRGYPCLMIEGANHSLETGCVEKDIQNLSKIMEETRRFIEWDRSAESVTVLP